MTEKARKYLSDILIAIKLIEDFTIEVIDFSDYQIDLKTKSAVERQVAIIGEAVNKFTILDIDFELTNASQIVAVRNRLIHSYSNIDDTIMWAILKNHLPLLKKEVLHGMEH